LNWEFDIYNNYYNGILPDYHSKKDTVKFINDIGLYNKGSDISIVKIPIRYLTDTSGILCVDAYIKDYIKYSVEDITYDEYKYYSLKLNNIKFNISNGRLVAEMNREEMLLSIEQIYSYYYIFAGTPQDYSAKEIELDRILHFNDNSIFRLELILN
jgi:hypothetical protein